MSRKDDSKDQQKIQQEKMAAILKEDDEEQKNKHPSGGLIREYPFRFGPGYAVEKAKPPRRSIADPKIMPSGKDDGKGAAKVMATYLDHVLHAEYHPHNVKYVQPEFFSQHFHQSSFEQKLSSIELQNIPNQSAVHTQKHRLNPKNSQSTSKKFFVFVTMKLKHCDPSLVRLRLNGLAINDFILAQLCKGLVRNTYLQYLMLHSNNITDEGVESLCSALQYHPVFHTLWIGSNRITDHGMRHLAELCYWRGSQLIEAQLKGGQEATVGVGGMKEINVSNKWPNAVWAAHEYELHPYISYIGIEYLVKFLQKSYDDAWALIRQLQAARSKKAARSSSSSSSSSPSHHSTGGGQLGQQPLGDGGTIEEERATMPPPHLSPNYHPILDSLLHVGLTALSLANQRIRDDGAKLLFDLCRRYPLRSLNLAGNEIGDAACQYSLRPLLQGRPSHGIGHHPHHRHGSLIEELLLSHNLITDEGALCIAEGLAANSFLLTLDLSHNLIGHTGLYALYQSLVLYNHHLASCVTLGNQAKEKNKEDNYSHRHSYGHGRDHAAAAVGHRLEQLAKVDRLASFTSSSSSSAQQPSSSSSSSTIAARQRPLLRASLLLDASPANLQRYAHLDRLEEAMKGGEEDTVSSSIAPAPPLAPPPAALTRRPSFSQLAEQTSPFKRSSSFIKKGRKKAKAGATTIAPTSSEDEGSYEDSNDDDNLSFSSLDSLDRAMVQKATGLSLADQRRLPRAASFEAHGKKGLSRSYSIGYGVSPRQGALLPLSPLASKASAASSPPHSRTPLASPLKQLKASPHYTAASPFQRSLMKQQLLQRQEKERQQLLLVGEGAPQAAAATVAGQGEEGREEEQEGEDSHGNGNRPLTAIEAAIAEAVRTVNQAILEEGEEGEEEKVASGPALMVAASYPASPPLSAGLTALHISTGPPSTVPSSSSSHSRTSISAINDLAVAKQSALAAVHRPPSQAASTIAASPPNLLQLAVPNPSSTFTTSPSSPGSIIHHKHRAKRSSSLLFASFQAQQQQKLIAETLLRSPSLKDTIGGVGFGNSSSNGNGGQPKGKEEEEEQENIEEAEEEEDELLGGEGSRQLLQGVQEDYEEEDDEEKDEGVDPPRFSADRLQSQEAVIKQLLPLQEDYQQVSQALHQRHVVEMNQRVMDRQRARELPDRLLVAKSSQPNLSKGKSSNSSWRNRSGGFEQQAEEEQGEGQQPSQQRANGLHRRPYGRRQSIELGQTAGVPTLRSLGIKPIRSSVTAFGDSGQHLLYLRVATTQDPEDLRPTSLLKIGLDRMAARKQLLAERQSSVYKMQKALAIAAKPKELQRDPRVIAVPDTFWTGWRRHLATSYPKGIDRSRGAHSVALEPVVIPPPPRDPTEPDAFAKYDRSDLRSPWNRYLEFSRKPEQLGYQRHLGFKYREFSPGQILAARRKELLIKRTRQLEGKGQGPGEDQQQLQEKGEGKEEQGERLQQELETEKSSEEGRRGLQKQQSKDKSSKDSSSSPGIAKSKKMKKVVSIVEPSK